MMTTKAWSTGWPFNLGKCGDSVDGGAGDTRKVSTLLEFNLAKVP
jgi:hypothetical protein